MTQPIRKFEATRNDRTIQTQPDSTLVLGDLARWQANGRHVSGFDNINYADFANLNRGLLDRLNPDFILSPLVTGDFDAVEVAQRLQGLGFAGRYRALADHTPNANMIKSEVRGQAPDLDFDIIVINSRSAPTDLAS